MELQAEIDCCLIEMERQRRTLLDWYQTRRPSDQGAKIPHSNRPSSATESRTFSNLLKAHEADVANVPPEEGRGRKCSFARRGIPNLDRYNPIKSLQRKTRIMSNRSYSHVCVFTHNRM